MERCCRSITCFALQHAQTTKQKAKQEKLGQEKARLIIEGTGQRKDEQEDGNDTKEHGQSRLYVPVGRPHPPDEGAEVECDESNSTFKIIKRTKLRRSKHIEYYHSNASQQRSQSKEPAIPTLHGCVRNREANKRAEQRTVGCGM